MAIDLYLTILSPPARSVLLVAKHLGLEVHEKPLDLANGEHLKPEFVQLNPSHTVPTIVDDGFVLWESRAIIQYLANKYAPDSDIYPSEPKSRAQVDRMLNFDIGTFFPALRDALIIKLFRNIEPTEEQVQKLKTTLKLLDQFIGDNKYVAGTHLTIADISILMGATLFTFANYDLSDYPNVKEWYERVPSELPHFAEIADRAKAAAGAYLEGIRKKNEANK